MEDVNKYNFESFCYEKYVSNKTTNKSVTKAFINNVFNLLDGKDQDVLLFCNNLSAKLAKIKHKVKKKGYESMYIPGEDGVHTRVLTVPKITSAHTSGRLIVVPIEDFHPTLKALHQATNHGKERVMLRKIADQYEGLPKSAVQEYIRMCSTCSRNKAQVLQAPPRVKFSQGLFSHCQVDLVDMTRKPSGGCNYILHLMDDLSKFHLLAPLVQKTQAEVNLALSHMFGIIGIPAILETDNGSEFEALDGLLQQWPGSSDIVHGRPRHPQSQGVVERGNRVLEEKIAAMEATYHGDGPAPWHLWLPHVQYQLNTQVNRVIQMTPYERVFGKKPSPPPLGRPARVVAQEEVDVEMSQEDSQECDPLLDNSYPGTTSGPEADDENLSHETQVETTSAPEAEDENENVSHDAQVETTSAQEAEDENENVGHDAQVEEPIILSIHDDEKELKSTENVLKQLLPQKSKVENEQGNYSGALKRKISPTDPREHKRGKFIAKEIGYPHDFICQKDGRTLSKRAEISQDYKSSTTSKRISPTETNIILPTDPNIILPAEQKWISPTYPQMAISSEIKMISPIYIQIQQPLGEQIPPKSFRRAVSTKDAFGDTVEQPIPHQASSAMPCHRNTIATHVLQNEQLADCETTANERLKMIYPIGVQMQHPIPHQTSSALRYQRDAVDHIQPSTPKPPSSVLTEIESVPDFSVLNDWTPDLLDFWEY